MQSVKIPIISVLSGSAHQLQVGRLQVRSGRKPTCCVVHVAGWKSHLGPTLLVQYPERGSPSPRRSAHIWQFPQFLSLVFLTEALAWVYSNASLFSMELAARVLLRCCRQSLGDEVHSCGCTYIVLAAKSWGGYTEGIWDSQAMLGHGVQVRWRQHCAQEVTNSPVGEHTGQKLAQGGWCREVGMSAVLEAASAGCWNSNTVMVCQDMPV